MNAVVERKQVERDQPTAVVPMTPQALIQLAVEKGANVDQLAKLMDLQERWDANEAKKAYVEAMAQFKADPPAIIKNKPVSIPGGAQFSHATLAAVCDGVVAALSKYGFSHRWEVTQAERMITVTCVITHKLGHSERTTLAGAPDDSGKKNAIQQVGSTVTYLERYTLMAATGLAAKDMDNDARGAGSNGGQLSDKVAADHLTAIDDAENAEALKRAFGLAWNAAQDAKDKGAQRLFTEHRDARRKKLGVQS